MKQILSISLLLLLIPSTALCTSFSCYKIAGAISYSDVYNSDPNYPLENFIPIGTPFSGSFWYQYEPKIEVGVNSYGETQYAWYGGFEIEIGENLQLKNWNNNLDYYWKDLSNSTMFFNAEEETVVGYYQGNEIGAEYVRFRFFNPLSSDPMNYGVLGRFGSILYPNGYSSLTLGGEIISISQKAAPVPEPSTFVLMGLGIVGLAGLSRKKFTKR
jgi:hypothetical protein